MRPVCDGLSRIAPSLSLFSVVVTTTLCFSLRPSFGFVVTRRFATRRGPTTGPPGRRIVPSPQLRRSSSSSSSMASSTTTTATDHDSSTHPLRFCDIGANLLDARFVLGEYHGTVRHEPDLEFVVRRAMDAGCTRIVLTAGTVQESRHAVQTARAWNAAHNAVRFSCTVGVHPTRCKQVFVDDPTTDADALLNELLEIAQDGITDGTVVAIGEIGLDYDRLQFCPADVQRHYLQQQIDRVARPTGLPLFLHNRSVGYHLYNMLSNLVWTNGGVVHSFDDTIELATQFMDLGLYIGLNRCSLRTEENLRTAKSLPLERLLLETDCPYCEVRKTHPGYKYIQTHFPATSEKKFEPGRCVKGRQEPCHIVQVAEILAGCKDIPLQTVADACYQNSLTLFGWNDEADV